jgi:valyl-tRNA synthetase
VADWGPNVRLARDPDVLDTWFSSGLWPFSTLGWPDENHPDYKAFYPTTHLETGYDIIFFWVARMVMLGLELTGKLPFHTVYLHGLIRTADGKKMSKSRPDKIIDPLELIDSYGTDAVRFFLITAGAPGNDIKMDARKEGGKWHSDRIEGARNFANKLWNATRFVLSKVECSKPQVLSVHPAPSTQHSALSDRWILARLNQTIAEARRWSDEYQYGEAGRVIYEFIWNDYCDWYLELSKLSLNAPVLVHVLETSLRLLHPFMPYVTEELWQAIKNAKGRIQNADWNARFEDPALMLAAYPTADQSSIVNGQSSIDEMSTLQGVIRALRNVRAEYNVAPDKRIGAIIAAGDKATLLNAQREALCTLARVDDAQLSIAGGSAQPSQAVTVALGDISLHVPMSGLVDLAAERARLTEERAAAEAGIAKSEALLASDFGKRAPAGVIAKENAKLAELRAKLSQLDKAIAALA